MSVWVPDNKGGMLFIPTAIMKPIRGLETLCVQPVSGPGSPCEPAGIIIAGLPFRHLDGGFNHSRPLCE